MHPGDFLICLVYFVIYKRSGLIRQWEKLATGSYRYVSNVQVESFSMTITYSTVPNSFRLLHKIQYRMETLKELIYISQLKQ